MKTKIEIKSVFDKVLFEYEQENNTVKNTLLKAIEGNVILHSANLGVTDLKDIDLRNADLYCANLQGANLFSAILYNADLRSVNLYSAELYNADLCNANLCNADLHDARLRYVDFRSANLRSTNLRNADLRGVDLRDADLYNANLRSADLRDANLRGANLFNADLSGTDLRNADLNNAKNIPFIPTYLPEGEFIGWKKLLNGVIVKLKILEDSKRSRANGDKCRCDKALVLEFQDKDGTPSEVKEYTSNVYAECTYKVGEVVYADSWDDNRWNECSHGIHFFIDRQSAVNY